MTTLDASKLQDLLRDRKLETHGRTDPEHPFTFFWTASGIELRGGISELWMEVDSEYETNEIWVDVLADGVRLQKILLPRGKSRICLARNLDPSIIRTFALLRDTQPMPEESASLLSVCSVSFEGTLETLPQPEYRLEFIGDSITSGEGGIGAEHEMEWKSFVFDAVENYAFHASSLLHAAYRVISQSGWGVFCSWDGITKNAIPLYYDRVCGVLQGAANEKAGSGSLYDFSRFPVDAVIINLGTNDWNALDTGMLPEEQILDGFRRSAVSFLENIRFHNPGAQIVWAFGMLGYGMEDPIRSAIAAYREKTGDPDVHFLLLPRTMATEFGSRQHPGRVSHENAGRVLAAYLDELLAEQKA